MNTQVKQQPQAVAVATTPAKPKLLDMMAAQYNMEPAAFAAAVKKTAMPGSATNEEFAAYMMVAHEYGLNPFLRELYAFPKKGGGIVPRVSIDGWVNLVNRQPMLAGFELETHYDDDKKLAAVTCRMYRKDRSMPVVVTEYMIECFRNTEPWRQMPSRMLRHKAFIQAARYCFGLAGIHDEDEANDISGVKDITPKPPRPEPKDFIIPAKQDFQQQDKPAAETVNAETGEIIAEGEGPATEQEGETATYGNADAYNDGQTAFGAGVAHDKVPGHIAQLGFAEPWQAGWKDAEADHDAAVAAKTKADAAKDDKANTGKLV